MTDDPQAKAFERAELESLALFASADLDTLEPVLLGCTVQHLRAHEILIAVGTDHRNLFLILSGSLGVHLESAGAPAIATLGRGETVGEISLIDRKPASAFVVAAEPTRVLVLDEELLWILAHSSHAVAYNLLHTLASRLRSGNQLIRHERAEVERYKFHASVDALTGLFNRHWIDKMLARQMERSRGAREALSLLLIDVDQFKQFNDRHGHVAGDCALRAVATGMRGALRPSDMLARFGGEEFLVLLPGASLHNARDVAERLRSAVGHMPIHHVDGTQLPSVTVSIGAAQLLEDGSPEAFLERADRALYRAKSAGRNRVQA